MRGLYRLCLASTSLSLSVSMLISCESVSHGEARIFRAIEEGNVELTLYLVKKGQLEATKANGASPLMMAALAGDFELVKMLVEHGADIMHRDRKGCTTLQRLSFLCSRSKENLVKQAEQLREFGFPEEAIARIISSSSLPKQAEEKLEKFQKIIRYLRERSKRSVAGWEDSSFQPDGEAPSGQAPLCGAGTFRTLSILMTFWTVEWMY